jgi:hypothetical protein
MNCEKCGYEYSKSIYWIKNKRHCGECAADVFAYQLHRLRKRFTKLNKKHKLLTKELTQNLA